MGNSCHSCMVPLIFTSTLRTVSRPVCFYPQERAPGNNRWEGRTIWEQIFTSLQGINARFLSSPHSSLNPGSLCESPSTYTWIIWQDLEEHLRQRHDSIPAELYKHTTGMSAMTSNSVCNGNLPPRDGNIHTSAGVSRSPYSPECYIDSRCLTFTRVSHVIHTARKVDETAFSCSYHHHLKVTNCIRPATRCFSNLTRSTEGWDTRRKQVYIHSKIEP
jgi:hypothetical protein